VAADGGSDGGGLSGTDVTAPGAGSREPYAPTRISPPVRNTTSHEAHQASHRCIQLPLQHLRRSCREVAEFPRHTNEAFGFRRRSQGDSQMATEKGPRTEGVSFDDVGFNGDDGPPQLVDDCPVIAWSSARGSEGRQSGGMGMLPSVESPVLMHLKRWRSSVNEGSPCEGEYGLRHTAPGF